MLSAVATATGVPASSKVPNPRPDRFVTIAPLGGAGRSSTVKWTGTFTYEAWATTAPAARALAFLARAHLLALARTTRNGVTFYKVTDVATPGDLPDPESGQERFVGTFEIVCRESAV